MKLYTEADLRDAMKRGRDQGYVAGRTDGFSDAIAAIRERARPKVESTHPVDVLARAFERLRAALYIGGPR